MRQWVENLTDYPLATRGCKRMAISDLTRIVLGQTEVADDLCRAAVGLPQKFRSGLELAVGQPVGETCDKSAGNDFF